MSGRGSLQQVHRSTQVSMIHRFEKKVHGIDHRLTFKQTNVMLCCYVVKGLFHSFFHLPLEEPLPLLCLEPHMVMHEHPIMPHLSRCGTAADHRSLKAAASR